MKTRMKPFFWDVQIDEYLSHRTSFSALTAVLNISSASLQHMAGNQMLRHIFLPYHPNVEEMLIFGQEIFLNPV